MVNIREEESLDFDIDDIINNIFLSDTDLNKECSVLVINNPMVDLKTFNSDIDVIEPKTLQDVHLEVLEAVMKKPYGLILVNNIESYLLKHNNDYPLRQIMQLSKQLEMLDEIHLETYVLVSPEARKDLTILFDNY